LTTNQYKAGIVSYLNVVTVQTIALTNERAAISISGQRLNAAVLLVKALGGGWSVTEAHGIYPAILNSPAPSWEENAP
jgi:outer membrane protein TolC